MPVLKDTPWRRKMLLGDDGMEKSAEALKCTEARINEIGEQIFDSISSQNDGLVKQAESLLNDFIPARIREESFLELICPGESVSNEELDRSVADETPMYIIDMEEFTPMAMSVPFNTAAMGSPEAEYVMYARRLPASFSIIKSRTFTKHISLFRTWRHDMQQVYGDNVVRDILTEMDSQFVRGHRELMVAPNTVLPASGIAQWLQIGGSISRASLNPVFTVLLRTPASLDVNTVLTNLVTMHEFTAWDRLEAGGDLAQDTLTRGVSAVPDVHGKKYISTIKRGLVPDNRWFLYGPNRFALRHKYLTPPTMHVKTENLQVRFWVHTERSVMFCNPNAVAIADFTGSYQ